MISDNLHPKEKAETGTIQHAKEYKSTGKLTRQYLHSLPFMELLTFKSFVFAYAKRFIFLLSRNSTVDADSFWRLTAKC